MKVAAVILTVIFVVSGVLFGLSVAATGVDYSQILGFGSAGQGIGESYYVFAAEEVYDNISVSVASADTVVKLSNDGVTRVSYENSKNSNYITADITGGKLTVKEHVSFQLFNFFGWGFRSAELVIELPEREYNRIEYTTASGDGNAELPDSDKLVVKTSSGDVKISTYTDNLDINTSSGKTEVTNRGGEKCSDITLWNSSGQTLVNGFEADTFKITCTSGNITASGISGRGNVSVTSGDLELIYSDWNDSLKLSVTSGDVNVYLPNGSGVDFTSSITSGEVSFDLDGDRGSLRRNDKNASGGGNNKQSVSLTVTSGDVSFKTLNSSDTGVAYTFITEAPPASTYAES